MIKLMDILSEGIGSLQLKTFKVFIKGYKKPFRVAAMDNRDAKRVAHEMMRNNKVKIQKVVKEGKLTEGKFQMKGKYLYMPGGQMSSIPGPRDRDAIMVNVGRETFAIFFNLRNKLYAASDKYSKEFKNSNDLAKWLNKEKAKYIGIDRR